MMIPRIPALFLVAFALMPCLTATGADPRPDDVLKVAVCEHPPYCHLDQDSKWSGLGISLWEEIAGRLGLRYEYREIPFDKIVASLASGETDLTPFLPLSREKRGLVRFTEPYLISHGALATRKECIAMEGLYLTRKLFNRHLLSIFALILAGMLVFSVIILFLERRNQGGSFSGNTWKGLGTALWFSAVTMTTVGYGDKTPSSPSSRLLTFFWMMFGVLIIALFTGSISSTLTSADSGNGIIRIEDLNRFDVGVVQGSMVDAVMQSRGIPFTPFPTLDDSLLKLRDSASISAVAGDNITMNDLISRRFPGQFNLSLIPSLEELHSIACRTGLPSYDSINSAVMDISLAPDWRARCQRWTGPITF